MKFNVKNKIIVCLVLLNVLLSLFLVCYLYGIPNNVRISVCTNGGDLIEQINSDAHSFVLDYNYPRTSVLIDALSYAECKAIAININGASENGIGYMCEGDIRERIRVIADYYESKYRDHLKKELLVCNMKRSWLERIGLYRKDIRSDISYYAQSTISNEREHGRSQYLVFCRTEFEVPWMNMYQSVGMREFHSNKDTNGVEYMSVNNGFIVNDDNDLTAMRIPLKFGLSLIILQPHEKTIGRFIRDCVCLSSIYDFMFLEGTSVMLYLPCVTWGEEDVFPHDYDKEVRVLNSCVIRYIRDEDRCKSFEERKWTIEELEGSRVVDSAFVYYIVDADRRIVLYAGTYE